MADLSVVARPYAKALFEYAVDTQTLEAWAEALIVMAVVVRDPTAVAFITNPASSPAQREALLLTLFQPKDPLHEPLQRWVKMLVAEERVLALPEIETQYRALKDAFQQLICVHVKTFSPLSVTQEKTLIEKLRTRLQRQIELKIEIDPELLGGLVIQAGDWVIDHSARSKLQTLYTALVA